RHNSKQELHDKDKEDGDGINKEFFVDVYWIARKEQDLIDQIIHGKLAGQMMIPTAFCYNYNKRQDVKVDKALEENQSVDDREVKEVWYMVGEKQWLLSRIGLIVDCDDDVMDEQKWLTMQRISESQMRRPVLDHENMIAIDIDFKVRPDLIVILNVFREIYYEKGFKEQLESVLGRIGDIESLG
ncbi:hypothetical protein BY996DRAFT_8478917, partial [Phakopsora pachyrhizi]